MATHRRLTTDERADVRHRFLTLASRGYDWERLTQACGEHGGFAKSGVEHDFRFYRLDSYQRLRYHMREQGIDPDETLSLVAQRRVTVAQVTEILNEGRKRVVSDSADALEDLADGAAREADRLKWREDSQLPAHEPGASGRRHQEVLEGDELEEFRELFAYLRTVYGWTALRPIVGYANRNVESLKRAAERMRFPRVSLDLARDFVAHLDKDITMERVRELGRQILQDADAERQKLDADFESYVTEPDRHPEAFASVLSVTPVEPFMDDEQRVSRRDMRSVFEFADTEKPLRDIATWEDELEECKRALSVESPGESVLRGALESIDAAARKCPIPLVKRALEGHADRVREAQRRVDEIVFELLTEVAS